HFVPALIIAGRLSWQIFLIRRDIGAVPPDPVEPDEGTASKAVWRSLKLLRRSPTSSPLQAAFRGRSTALPRRVSRGNLMTNSHLSLTNYRLSVRVQRPILGLEQRWSHQWRAPSLNSRSLCSSVISKFSQHC